MTQIILIDPRPASKDAMIQKLQDNAPVIGIEFTLPVLAQYIARNIDGQHIEGGDGKAAIELALTVEIPHDHATYAIVRPDVDALGAVAVLELRRRQFTNDEYLLDGAVRTRIDEIATHDKFANGSWPGIRPVAVKSLTSNALGVITSNHKMPIEERVALVEQYLLTGTCDGLETARAQALASLEQVVKESIIAPREFGIVAIESAHIGATQVGYHYGPVLVIRNEHFRFQGGAEHIKYTICEWNDIYLDMNRLVSALNEAEKSGGTWGGGKTILGSPQGVSSTLTMDEVVKLVDDHKWSWCGKCGNPACGIDLDPETGYCC